METRLLDYQPNSPPATFGTTPRRNRAARYRLVLACQVLAVIGCGCRPESTIVTQIPAPARALFDGTGLDGWRIVDQHDFQDHGGVTIEDGVMVLHKGSPATGIAWTGAHPRINYEITLEAKRIDGNDFFCGLTFPVGETYCSLILGGWGGGVVGLSNIDGRSAVENETTGYTDFLQDRWYSLRLRVTDVTISAWLDDRLIVSVDTEGRQFAIWWEQEPLRPLGIASWYTKAGLRNIRVSPVTKKAVRQAERNSH